MSEASQAKLAGFAISVLAFAWMGIDLYTLSQAVREGTPRDSGEELANAVRVASLFISGTLCFAAAIIAKEIAKLRMTTSPEK